MDRFNAVMERYFMPVAEVIAEQRHLKAIRDGIITTMPLLIIGSVFLIIAFPPIEFLGGVHGAVRPDVNHSGGRHVRHYGIGRSFLHCL